jgi:cytochrome c oxidase subunit 4
MSDHNVPTTDGDDDHGEHHGNMKTFVYVFLSLCGLTTASFVCANLDIVMSTPAVGWALMMAISCTKAMLVITFFMHMLWESNWKFVLTIPASMMSLFLVLMLLPDIGLRTRHYSESRWRYAPEPQEVQDVHHGEGDEESDGEEEKGESEDGESEDDESAE